MQQKIEGGQGGTGEGVNGVVPWLDCRKEGCGRSQRERGFQTKSVNIFFFYSEWDGVLDPL